MTRRPWTEAEDATMRARYPKDAAQDLARSLGRSERAVYMRANLLGLRKDAEWMADRTRRQWAAGQHENSRRAHFKPGQEAWNKGRPAAEWIRNVEPCRATQFKPGRPASEARNYRPIGSLRVSGCGLLERKVTDDPSLYPARRWVAVHRIVWEAANGPVPPGHVVRFREGKATTNEHEITLDRLELVSRVENMRRNSRHNRYPPEVNQLIQLVGALNRKINNRSRGHEEQDAGRA